MCNFQLIWLSRGSVLTNQMEGWPTKTLQQFLTESVALQFCENGSEYL